MKSLKDLYKIGSGPSSSHTMGPERACRQFKEAHPDADSIEITLYGSLSLTGKGHLTDHICRQTCAPIPCRVFFSEKSCDRHPNAMDLRAYENGQLTDAWRVYSVGGGAIVIEGKERPSAEEVYPETSFSAIMEYCKEHHIGLKDYVDQYEDVDGYLTEIMEQMLSTVEKGLHTEGTLPGRLNLKRVASQLYESAREEQNPLQKQKILLMAYAYAASEENASGGTVVTAPTLGSSGVLPSLIRYYIHDRQVPRTQIITGLKIAGIIGNLFKTNATISGAEGGCQAEIGVACAMGSGLAAYIEGLDDNLTAYAAEIGIEHFLGLTCDPVGGYVMIPCIERNAVAALRATDSALLASQVGRFKRNRVTLDMIIETMHYTGKRIPEELRETAIGGLASVVPMPQTR
ncbi:MAG: L-serine ammonia-lyase, iron-sulfur-dependent, subunit alpha [Clostridiales bacterium]|nr:L-serine ammonia-lyase, iron-sulfur-dependent, subunit alpha [Clostridiales bacterium]